MTKIIRASEVKVGDKIRMSLRGYFFSDDPKWREHCERELHVSTIVSADGQTLEFQFDDATGSYRGVNPNTEVVLTHRPWPEGKTEENMYRKVQLLISRQPVGGYSLDVIQEAIETLYLGLAD
ncbi:MAG: hypothetical protein UT43_C0020G0013 [Parcubacteria group bacterium GW2011_GWC1_39_29]|nr:MAG: hypothetical protein UT43_C0020G0013 [Parcubacteria group bacterium GW2011_GWC1_39_29]